MIRSHKEKTLEARIARLERLLTEAKTTLADDHPFVEAAIDLFTQQGLSDVGADDLFNAGKYTVVIGGLTLQDSMDFDLEFDVELLMKDNHDGTVTVSGEFFCTQDGNDIEKLHKTTKPIVIQADDTRSLIKYAQRLIKRVRYYDGYDEAKLYKSYI